MKPPHRGMNRRRFLTSASAATAVAVIGIREAEAAPSESSGLKITNLKIVLSAPPRPGGWNWIFLKIETDGGIHGWGEASLQEKDAGVIAEIETFKKFLVGQDPFQIEHIWTSLHRRVTWTGGPVTMSAISAIDLALWDIKGKALGVPVYELFGGKVRDTVKLYANGWFDGDTPEAYCKKAKETASMGYKCLKLYPLWGASGNHSGTHATRRGSSGRCPRSGGTKRRDWGGYSQCSQHLGRSAGGSKIGTFRSGFHGRADSLRQFNDTGRAGPQVESADCRGRTALHALGIPCGPRKECGRHHSTRHLPRRRHLGTQEDRGHGGNLLRYPGPA